MWSIEPSTAASNPLMEGILGRIHSCESFGTLDGPGIRFVVFLQGCPLRCRYCHNPDTWRADDGKIISSAELMKQIESCRNFLRNGGVTLSGGEPLMQPEFSLDLLRRCRKAGFHTALDTAGSLPLERTRETIDAADLLLLDIKVLEPELCKELTGQDNQNELATLEYCEKSGKAVWIRHVLLPGITLRRDRLEELAEYLKPFRCIRRVELLPYHKLGEFKWKELGLDIPFAALPLPSPEERNAAEALFSAWKW